MTPSPQYQQFGAKLLHSEGSQPSSMAHYDEHAVQDTNSLAHCDEHAVLEAFVQSPAAAGTVGFGDLDCC